MENFESLSQLDGLVGKPDQSVHLGEVCRKGSFGSLVGFGWFSLIRDENRSLFIFFRFMTL